jgi:hypothetical protein
MMAKNSRPISSDAAAIPRCGYWAASAGRSHSNLGEKNSTVADAILDRLASETHRVELKGESMRKQRNKKNNDRLNLKKSFNF